MKKRGCELYYTPKNIFLSYIKKRRESQILRMCHKIIKHKTHGRRTIYIKILLVWYIKEYIGIVMQVHINFTFSYFPFYYTCGRFRFSFLYIIHCCCCCWVTGRYVKKTKNWAHKILNDAGCWI